MKRYALTAIGRDRPGIVAGVTKVLFKHGCNIEDSSMTRLEDEFAMILIMSMADWEKSASLANALKKAGSEMGLTIHFKEIGEKAPVKGPESNYIITLHGADAPGIVYRVAEALSRKGVNITDLETKIVGEEKKIYIMVMEVYSPGEVGIKGLEGELKALGESLGVTIRLKSVEAYEPL